MNAHFCEQASACGGCPLGGMPYDEALEQKRRRVSEAFDFEDVQFFAPQPFHYRNRFRVNCVGGKVAFPFADMSKCRIVDRELCAIMARVQETMQTHEVLPALADGFSVEVRAPDAEGKAGVFLSAKRDLSSLVHALKPLLPSVIVSCRELPGVQVFKVDRAKVRVPLSAFMQVNSVVNTRLVQALCEHRGSARSFVELFCGSGNFALNLAARGLRGVALDVEGEAIDACQAAAEAQGFEQLRFIRGRAEAYRSEKDIELLVANPPRAGLRNALETLLGLAPKRMLLVCCGLESLAKDVAALTREHYRLSQVQAFDMFAHTKWVETLVVLDREA